MQYRYVALIFVFLTVVVFAAATNYDFPRGGRHLLPPSLGKQMLKPCSRKAPTGVTAFWEPSEEQINNLEAGLVVYMSSLQKAGTAHPSYGSYNRQYVGIVRRGKRLIYGNFYPSTTFNDTPALRENEATRLVDVCDSGPEIWGVVFNPKTNAFSDLSFGWGI